MQAALENPWVVGVGTGVITALVTTAVSRLTKQRAVGTFVAFLCGAIFGGMLVFLIQQQNKALPLCLGEFQINGGNPNGVQCLVAQTGDYNFQYIEGAYFVGGARLDEAYRTQLAIFVDTDVPPLNDDVDIDDFSSLRLRENVKSPDTASAEATSLQTQETDYLYLEEGSVLTLLAPDYGSYRDNKDFVTYRIVLDSA
jgi:hypothetical protein